jgi:hypothetical protein
MLQAQIICLIIIIIKPIPYHTIPTITYRLSDWIIFPPNHFVESYDTRVKLTIML